MWHLVSWEGTRCNKKKKRTDKKTQRNTTLMRCRLIYWHQMAPFFPLSLCLCLSLNRNQNAHTKYEVGLDSQIADFTSK